MGLKPNTIEQARFGYSPWGNIFNKGLDKDDQKEGLFKRIKNIENAQKNLIRDSDNESIYYAPRLELDDKDKKQQTNNIDTKPSNVFDYLKSLSQEANDLMDEIEEVNDYIDIYKLAFIGSNKETFNFNAFRMPLNFLLAIYSGEITLKKAEFEQREKEKKIEELQFNHEPKKKKEKEDIDGVLMQAKDLLKYGNKIIDVFKDGTFMYNHLKESDDAAYDYALKYVNNSIEEIQSMEEKKLI